MSSRNVANAVAAISAIDAVPTILEVVCRTTGMGFAAVARVTEDRWIACGVRDEIGFGLQPGGELEVETTICNEIRESREPVIIENVADDPVFCGHHTPARYGFQSYFSMPIVTPDGAFFGTLCAIDPKPRRLKTPETLGMFKLFADLVGFHLDAHLKIERADANLALEVRRTEDQRLVIAGLERDAEIAEDRISEQTRAERQLRVLQRELVHRMKNTLSMAQAIVSQTLRHAEDPREASEIIAERLQALSRAQDVLTETNWANADIREVVTTALAPHRDRARIAISGPRCSVTAQQALGLSLALHELGTNAAKYGALSRDRGAVAVDWSVGDDNAFHFRWRETGGPAVTPPARRGFGSRLLERIVASYFSGRSAIRYDPAGVQFDLDGRISGDLV